MTTQDVNRGIDIWGQPKELLKRKVVVGGPVQDFREFQKSPLKKLPLGFSFLKKSDSKIFFKSASTSKFGAADCPLAQSKRHRR